MARKAFCSECGREVWLGRDGGCQFGHSAAQLSGVREADAQAVSGGTPLAASPPAPTPPPVRAVAPPTVAPPPPAPPFAAPAPSASATDAGNAWGNTPDDLTGGRADGGFDYLALPSDFNIGDTECLVRRCVARVLDKGLTGVLVGVLLLPLASPAILSSGSGIGPEYLGVWSVLTLAVTAAYFVLLPLLWNGRTLGKAIVGITVTDLQGHTPTLGKLVLRELAMLIDGFFYGIVGLVIASKSPRSQRIGDVWAETVVVRTR